MLKKGKQVEIICGKDKGKKGEIIEINKKLNKVKINIHDSMENEEDANRCLITR